MMFIEDDGLIDTAMVGTGGPLCPQSLPPANALHTLSRRIGDEVWEAAPKDDNQDVTDPAVEQMTELAYGGRDRMRLYRDVVSARSRERGLVGVEALYFRCPVCGFVLPAARTPTR